MDHSPNATRTNDKINPSRIDCPHMTGDAACSVCIDLHAIRQAYRLCHAEHETLRAELARIREGAAEHDPAQAVQPTPAEAWRKLLAMPAEDRLTALDWLMVDAAAGQNCRMMLHAEQLTDRR